MVRTIRGRAGLIGDPEATIVVADGGYAGTTLTVSSTAGEDEVEVTIRGRNGGIRGRTFLSRDDVGALARELVAAGMHLAH